MKKLVLFFLFLSLCFTAGFYGVKEWQSRQFTAGSTILSPKETFPNYTLVNHPFVILIVGVNNGATVEKTLQSVFSQTYENFRLVYIDDGSDDGSSELARELINQTDRFVPVTIVQNEKRLGVLENIIRGVESASDEEIIVILDGEDWLAHEWVLQRLNAAYADPNIWLTLGKYIDFPTFQYAPPFEFAAIRSSTLKGPHLKSFYAKLFRKIHGTDFIASGSYLSASAELAYMLPMLEMAKNHYVYLDEVLSIHNKQATYKESKEITLRCEQWIRSLKPYQEITSLDEEVICD